MQRPLIHDATTDMPDDFHALSFVPDEHQDDGFSPGELHTSTTLVPSTVGEGNERCAEVHVQSAEADTVQTLDLDPHAILAAAIANRDRRQRSDRIRNGNSARGNVNDPVTQYLNAIGTRRLLTAAEEVELGTKILAGKASAARLEDREEVQNLAEREVLISTARQGETARREFIECNLKLVVSIAKQYTNKSDLLTLVQYGNLGLEHAVDKFDPNRGLRFSTYAVNWIRSYIKRGIDADVNLIKIGDEKLQDDVYKYRDRRFMGDSPTTIAEEMGWTEAHLAKVERVSTITYPVPLDMPVGEGDDGSTFADFIPDVNSSNHGAEAEFEIMFADMLEDIDRLLDNPEHTEMLKLKMGLNEKGKKHSNRLIGEKYGITAEAARQQIKRIINTLKSNNEFISKYQILAEVTE